MISISLYYKLAVDLNLANDVNIINALSAVYQARANNIVNASLLPMCKTPSNWTEVL
jgi:hypothetical protein